MRLGIFKKLYAFMEKAGREYRNKNDLAELQKTLEELKTYFPKSILPASLEGLAQYPAKGFKGGSDDLYAYHIVFLLDAALTAQVRALVNEIFPIIVKEEGNKVWARNNEGEGITCFSTPEFEGVAFAIFTNSARFIRNLDALEVYPPSPWVSFPDADPKYFRPNQDDREAWWYAYWRPFWEALAPEKKQAYLERHKEHEDWMEYIQWYGRDES